MGSPYTDSVHYAGGITPCYAGPLSSPAQSQETILFIYYFFFTIFILVTKTRKNMKNTSFIIASLLASTHVYGVQKTKSDVLKGSTDMYSIISNFLPADKATSVMTHSNKTLKNHVDLGQTQGGHFHVYKIASRSCHSTTDTPHHKISDQ
jgi:hypothetical protein